MSFCCEYKNPEALRVTDGADASELVDAFLEMKDRVILRNQGADAPCEGCDLLQSGIWPETKIDLLNFSTHSWCQFSCIYCALQHSQAGQKNKPELYDCIALADELARRELLSETLHIECAPGEITVHPNRGTFYDFIEKHAHSVSFFSNAGRFDQRLADLLRANSNSSMVVSVDSGTRETFYAVHGADMFHSVIGSLKQYREYSQHLLLKYIILNKNCGEDDIDGFLSLCKELRVEQFLISSDITKARSVQNNAGHDAEIVSAALRLIKGAIKGNLAFSVLNLGRQNLKELYRRLAQEPEIVSCGEKLDRLLSCRQIVFYGTGRNSNSMISHYKMLGLREPDMFWDLKARRAQTEQEFSGRGSTASDTHMGYPVYRPRFDLLDGSRDTAICITLVDESVNRELKETMLAHHFNQFISYSEFNLALIGKQAKQWET